MRNATRVFINISYEKFIIMAHDLLINNSVIFLQLFMFIYYLCQQFFTLYII